MNIKSVNDPRCCENALLQQQSITAVAFIHHNFEGIEKVFLPKRANTKKFLPNTYELPGGHIHFGEDIVTGLQREIQEEFSKTIQVGDVCAVFTYHNEVKNTHSIEVCYFAVFTDGIDTIQLDPEEHSHYGWFAVDEISTALANNSKECTIALRGFALLSGTSLNFA